ncbi:uncharacterized protein DUF1538 [Desulfitobacterium sp. LBE]|uniref:Membrane protein n=4 Tax=root TaxID=1 RepID=A0A098B6G1_DESHA|nr:MULTISPECIES: DUF1538 domain-containing protein [Desulfitobacterium]ACL19202.1 protein of unknown function DUF1538 [Desulfitobacterium hafniense DCB-2]EHL06154.1 hypothetical protein HMPREF0322_03242 [Desulfitobacterium hafniense DP7]MEA5025016.1 DUF1538 domain-containing protein [Desulfitobacterium hafniense]TWH57898.1 uncharacterized protein DUF1538 [Desulfitobacterium sp. LBE]CDX04424.1 Membrane protein [Desulfitobacterium hafniense]
MNVLLEKLKEVLISVVPIIILVLVLNFTIIPMEPLLVFRFLLGALLIVLGLAIFLFGVDIGISKIGTLMGGALTKSNKLWIVVAAGLVLGFFISIAEPDLHILAGQVDMVTSGVIAKLSIVVVVSIGIAVMLTTGLVRIIYNIPLYKLLTVLYLIILGLSFFTSSEFLAISFDASGATTGALTVPFMLALALGVSSLKKDGKASEKDSFGLVAVTSAGAIIAVMIMSILSKQDEITGSLQESVQVSSSLLAPFINKLPVVAFEIFIALLPIMFMFFLFQKISFKLSSKAYRKVLKGLVYTFIGLVLFLTGVNAGFMEVGSKIGYNVAVLDSKWIIVVIGFILGLVVILAEPAVYVLTHQIEDVTSGYVKRPVVLIALSIGVAFAVSLSMIRILIPGLQLWHFLLPGYVVSILMMYFVPKLFVGMAFDAGGVASGPMTATFILAFAQGAAEAIEGANVMVDGFGVIAMVAMTPIIALQTLGFIFKMKSVKEGLKENEA